PHSARSRLLDVVILRDVVFKTVLKLSDMKIDKDISYVRSIPDALGKVKSGEAKLAFMVNPIDPKTVFELAQKHQRMPEKSTDFYPKIVSGLTLMDLSPEEKL
ncbi:DUF1015 family protein, partial [Candidatus Bathyarchaeota archaeon]|nr:DUF1015 family protein [Candidatus Bathyarchaeota archaeon]